MTSAQRQQRQERLGIDRTRRRRRPGTPSRAPSRRSPVGGPGDRRIGSTPPQGTSIVASQGRVERSYSVARLDHLGQVVEVGLLPSPVPERGVIPRLRRRSWTRRCIQKGAARTASEACRRSARSPPLSRNRPAVAHSTNPSTWSGGAATSAGRRGRPSSSRPGWRCRCRGRRVGRRRRRRSPRGEVLPGPDARPWPRLVDGDDPVVRLAPEATSSAPSWPSSRGATRGGGAGRASTSRMNVVPPRELQATVGHARVAARRRPAHGAHNATRPSSCSGPRPCARGTRPVRPRSRRPRP